LRTTRRLEPLTPVVGDPVAAGFVASLARPGVGEADVTAFSKQVEQALFFDAKLDVAAMDTT
jgi:hypothetical protein